MAKPIFLVGFPIGSDHGAVQAAHADLEKKLGDEYHVLTYRTSKIEEVHFQVLNAINASDIEIADLIKKTEEAIAEILAQYLADEFDKLSFEYKNNQKSDENI